MTIVSNGGLFPENSGESRRAASGWGYNHIDIIILIFNFGERGLIFGDAHKLINLNIDEIVLIDQFIT
jgi:hypothetical protein